MPLRILAAELIELDRIRVGFGAFGYDFHAEVVCERDERTQDHRTRPLAVRAHEGSVDLDAVERKPLQVGERGVAAAEVVERRTGAQVADSLQHFGRVLWVLHPQSFWE